jgi:PAS domain S-box-containing protein
MYADVKIGFDILFDNASIGIVIVNEEGRIVLANPFLLQRFGYQSPELSGQPLHKLIPSYPELSQYAFLKQHEPEQALYAIDRNGNRFPVEINLTAYETEGERLVMACISDISRQRKAEQDLARLNAQLEHIVEERTRSLTGTVDKLARLVAETEAKDAELNRANSFLRNLSEMKSRFVTMASHEFRTPLSTVLSSAFLISQYPGAEDHAKREKHVQRIVSSVNMLTNILNDFLSVGKIEEGKIQVRNADFDIRQNVTNLIAELDGILKKGQHITYRHEGDTAVRLDPELLKHIMMNLISNAVKFSAEEKQISITSTKNAESLVLTFADEGIGIPAEDQKHLFERFFRGSNVNNIPGTGLGLHIIRKYTELMNGSIECASNTGEGSTFTVMFAIENH